MHIRLLLCIVFLLNNSCFSGLTRAGPEPQSQKASAGQPDTGSPWETWLEGYLSGKLGTKGQAWVLLSSGGFAGAGNGQMIFISQEQPSHKNSYLYFLPSHKTPERDEKPDTEEDNLGEAVEVFLDFAKEFPQSGFKNKYPAMDGFSYEFFHFQSGSPLKKVTHFRMDYPGYSHDGSKPHQKIIEAFRILRKKAKSLKDAKK